MVNQLPLDLGLASDKNPITCIWHNQLSLLSLVWVVNIPWHLELTKYIANIFVITSKTRPAVRVGLAGQSKYSCATKRREIQRKKVGK